MKNRHRSRLRAVPYFLRDGHSRRSTAAPEAEGQEALGTRMRDGNLKPTSERARKLSHASEETRRTEGSRNPSAPIRALRRNGTTYHT